MTNVYVAWAISALVLILVAGLVGLGAPGHGLFGILIDSRGRYSLTKLQVTLWTVLVVSLIAGLFIARLLENTPDALGFPIPDQLLIVMGISVGSTAASTTIKASKDRKFPDSIAASDAIDKPRFAQIFLEEEGDYADQVVDIAKFQNFWFTLLVVLAYMGLAIQAIEDAPTVAEIALPGFTDTLLVLLGISHAGYLAGKLPSPSGPAPGLTLHKRSIGATPQAVGAGGAAETYVPRNP